jgi:hypothetical protein
MASTPWSQPTGNGSFFSWANGQNSTNLFGSPFLQGGTQFVFIPSAFIANASNGSSDTKSDTFDVDLHAFAGYKFTEIRIQTLGDYSVTPPGSVNTSGQMNINEIGGGGRNTVDSLAPTVSMPITSGTGNWSANALRDLSLLELGNPFTDIHITFSNSVIAISGAGGSAEIAETAVGFPIAVTVIPEPGAVALLGLAGLVVARRRR